MGGALAGWGSGECCGMGKWSLIYGIHRWHVGGLNLPGLAQGAFARGVGMEGPCVVFVGWQPYMFIVFVGRLGLACEGMSV